jgi:archaemetzincin
MTGSQSALAIDGEPTMRRISTLTVLCAIVVIGSMAAIRWMRSRAEPIEVTGDTHPEIEKKLQPIGKKLGKPQPGDWLASHKEEGQTFDEYLRAHPVRKSDKLKTIYICQIGEFTADQKKIIDCTREYLEIYFATPVKIRKTLALADIPEKAKRTHPKWGDKQILSTYVLEEVLQPDRPDDALAYLAFTSSDLWPGGGWNFVFGQASLRERTGVWSIYRNGNLAKDADAFRLCLRRTLGTATHETGHILTMQHCIAFECNMNGSNSLPEADRQPLHPCPVCFRKLCWNLQVDPAEQCRKLKAFYVKSELKDEVDWCDRATELLK